MHRIAYLGIDQFVLHRARIEMYPLPLSAYPIIGQIGEHMVQTVTPHQTILRFQVAMNLQTCTVVEIEGGIADGQCGPFLYLKVPIYNIRYARGDHRILRDDG